MDKICLCTGGHCEITNNELGGQIVLDESCADDVTVPVRVETGKIRSKLRYSWSIEIFKQYTVSSGAIQG